MLPHFSLIPLPEFALLPYAGFMDKLRFSADEGDLSSHKYLTFKTYGFGCTSVKASSGIELNVESIASADDLLQSCCVVFFGGRSVVNTMGYVKHFKPLIKKLRQHNIKVMAVDTAVFLFAAAGILKNKKVCVHWRHQDEFKDLFPNIKIATDLTYTLDEGIATCAGGTTSIELAIDLISDEVGRAKATKGLADMLIERQRSNQELAHVADVPKVRDAAVHRTLLIMNDNLMTKMTIEQIANMVGISRRQLDRKMQSEFEMSAADYFQQLKLKQGKWLLKNSARSVADIAESLGFSSDSYFRSLLKKHFKTTPSQIRQR
ncbi:MAG: helix-turn-helix domain-containing protein [Pseudomonadota bacterium]|nr:helix-turn-helix domain-containing protein [Pseudomonadota bacterium]